MYPGGCAERATCAAIQSCAARVAHRHSAACESEDAFTADNYDQLSIHRSRLETFRNPISIRGGAHYRVVVDAEPADYDMEKIDAHAAQDRCRRDQLDG